MRVTIRVKPGSSRARVGGDHDGALVVAVHARAVEGAANAAVVASLAEALGCRRRDVTIVSGERGRTKVVDVPDACAGRIEALRGGHAD